MGDYTLHHGDCLEAMAAMDAGSVDAVVTDPPYGLEFMGKEWDRFAPQTTTASAQRTGGSAFHGSKFRRGTSGVRSSFRCGKCGGWSGAFSEARKGRQKQCRCEEPDLKYAGTAPAMLAFEDFSYAWAESALRVLKPSHYLLAFGGTRTWHRLACAIEDAGFEIRDTLMWLYGSGFPKGKSCLKPAWEPIILARKPGPMRELGIEACRIAADWANDPSKRGFGYGYHVDHEKFAERATVKNAPVKAPDEPWQPTQGRWPANLILECTCDETREGTAKTNTPGKLSVGAGYEGGFGPRVPFGYNGPDGKEPVRIHTDPNCPCAMLDGQTGTLTSGSRNAGVRTGIGYMSSARGDYGGGPAIVGSEGGASRFFYCAKASRSERNAGCEGMPTVDCGTMQDDSYKWEHDGKGNKINLNTRAANHHPTVKPLTLMRWLVKLVAQPGDVVVDPFAGSCTTGVACIMEGREFVGVEREQEYVAIGQRRLDHAGAQGRLPLDESPPLPPVAGRQT